MPQPQLLQFHTCQSSTECSGEDSPRVWCQQKGQSQLVAVIPPGALPGNQHAIRVLQCGAATCSCPANR